MRQTRYYVTFDGGEHPPLSVRFDRVKSTDTAICAIQGCSYVAMWAGQYTADMEEHAREEWAGEVQHAPPTLDGYSGAHIAGGDCPCKPEVAIRYTDEGRTALYRHRGPTELMIGREAAEVLAQDEWSAPTPDRRV